MQISELKNENGTYNQIKINTKNYIPFIEKKILCEGVLDSCLEIDENGITTCNYFMKKLLTDLKIVANYSDIDFSDEVVLDYDFLVESDIVNIIKESIDDSELEFINEMINCELEQKIKIGNSIESVLAKNLQKLIDKIPDEKSIQKIIKDIPKSINKITPANLEILKGVFNKQGDLSG